ncbi:type II secretion system protein [Desulfocurvus sp. DL9XJH121]
MNQNHVRARGRTVGFTLIEMAIVLVIIGLLAGLTLPMIGDLVKREKRTATSDFLEKARNEIIGFALINKRLPTQDEFENDLGIGKDPYGQALVYWADSNLSGTNLCSATPTDDLTLRLTDPSGDNDYGDLGFIVLSTGRNVSAEYAEPGSHVVQVWDQRSWTPTTGHEEFDDQYEYVSFNYLRNKICTNTTSDSYSPAGSDASFAADITDFSGEGAGDTANPTTGPTTVVVDTTANTVNMGADQGTSGNGSACVWYQGDAGNCTNGDCPWGTGVRVFFEFQTSENDASDTDTVDFGDGFTFAFMNAAANAPSDCGGTGSEFGYAGTSSAGELEPPKMAVEFDFFRSNPTTGTHPYRDPTNNHLAMDYWSTDGRSYDTRHGEIIGNPAVISPATNPVAGDAAFYTGTTAPWMEDTLTQSVRVEVNATSADTWHVEAWVKDCTSENCTKFDDLTEDYTAYDDTPTTNATLVYSASPSFDDFNFGWTIGTGGVKQRITLYNFGIKFLP